MLVNDKEMEFLTKNKIFFKGIVEDINDPKGYGRVRVRVLGVHSENKKEVPTSTLPWANICRSLDFGGLRNGQGISSIPQVGTWVYLFFDMGEYDRPVLMGAISGKDSGNYSLSADYKTAHTIKTPHNHMIKIDDSSDIIKIQHNNGSILELTPSSINITSTGTVNVNASSSVLVKSSSTVNIEGTSITLKSSSNTMVI